MKRILLTLFAGFCFSGLALAQDGKVAKKKAAAKQTANSADYAAKVKAKEARAKALDAGTAVPATTSKASAPKAQLVAEKAN